MGLFDKLFKKKEEPKKAEAPKMPKVKEPKKETELSAKDKATKAGEPYVNILNMELNPTNLAEGAFELDWNEIFIARLVKAGYMKKKDDTDAEIVDRWFSDVCRSVVLELFEQQDADPENRSIRNVNIRDIGNGRSEVS